MFHYGLKEYSTQPLIFNSNCTSKIKIVHYNIYGTLKYVDRVRGLFIFNVI